MDGRNRTLSKIEMYGVEIPEELIEIVRTKEPLDEYKFLEEVYPDIIAAVNRSDNGEENK